MGAGLIGSPALAKSNCSKACKAAQKAEFKTCKTGCAKDKVCKKECATEKKAEATACKTSGTPTCAGESSHCCGYTNDESPSGAFLDHLFE